MNSSLNQLFQSVMNINNQNQQQDHQEQQQQQQINVDNKNIPADDDQTSNTSVVATTSGDENNVMRFFTKTLSPQVAPLLSNNSPPSNTTPPTAATTIVNQLQEHTPKKALKSSIGGGVLPNLNFESKIPTHGGVYIDGGHISLDEMKPMTHIQDLESQTITIIQSTIKYTWGDLVSVNNNYICYAVKGEKIRVLERSSAQRALIKDVEGTITDMQFLDDSNDLLACATDAGMLYVYEIVGGGVNGGVIQPTLVQSTRILPIGTECMLKVRWCGANRLVVSGSGVVALSIVDFRAQQPSIAVAVGAGSHTNALAVNQSGTRIAYGGSSGAIGIIDSISGTRLSERPFSSSSPSLSVDFIGFVGGDDRYLVVGSNNNREVSIVRVDGWVTVQRLDLINGDQPCLLGLIDQYLFIKPTVNSRGYVAHIQDSNGMAHIDYITEFDVKKPILSFTIKSVSSTPGRSGIHQNQQGGVEERKEKKFSIYSIQSHAILFYSIKLCQQYLATDNYTDSNSLSVIQKDSSIDLNNNNNSIELLTPGKLFDQIPSSPPPVSLPDPSLFSQAVKSSSVTTNDILSPSSEGSDSEKSAGEDKKKLLIKKKKSSNNPSPSSSKNNNNNKNISTNVTDALLPSPLNNESSSSSPSFDQLLSPATLLQQTTSSINNNNNNNTIKKSNSSTNVVSSPRTVSPIQSPSPQPHIPKTTTTPTTTTTTTPTTTSTTKSKTPSIRPAPLNIPLTNPPNISSTTSLSSTTTPPTTNINQQQQQTTTTTTTPTTTATNPSPPTIQTTIESSSSSSSSSSSLTTNQEQIMTMMNQSIQSTVKSHLEKMIKKEVVPILFNLEKSMTQSFEQMTSKIMQESVKKLTSKSESILKTSMDGMASQIKTSVVTDAIEQAVKQQVETVFMEYFSGVLVPGFEKSCMTMFKHLSSSFDQALSQSIQQAQLAMQSQHSNNQKMIADQIKLQKEQTDLLINTLLKQQQQMQSDINKLINQNDQQKQLQHQQQQQQLQLQQQQQHNSMINLYSSPPHHHQIPQQQLPQQHTNNNYMSPSSSNNMIYQQLQQQQQQQYSMIKPISILNQYGVELKMYVEHANYANAFSIALNASNLSMVVDLCSVLDVNQVFSSTTPLQNAIIISLIQQLSYDLSSDVDLKLMWIKESIFQLDATHPSISEIVRKVLSPLKSKIESNPILLSKDISRAILSALKLILK